MDAGIAKREDYDVYKSGLEKNVYISAPNSDEPFVGTVWPGDSVYPDWFNPNTTSWWHDAMSDFFNAIPFDGLWLDMNEAANFCVGSCYENQKLENGAKYQMPYVPTGRDLNIQSIDIDAVHHHGETEADVHSLFGTMEVKATSEWFEANEKRTMIIERSAFAGLGKYGSRWLGDNFSQKEYMGYSVTGVMMHNIIGIPLAGADICGFIGDTTPELCARWHVVGAFYPFSRNHNTNDAIDQAPWDFQGFYEGQTRYIDIMRNAIQSKYCFIKYYYTALSLMSQGEESAFYKPVFFEFPNDNAAYNDPEYNIMLGSALKLSVLSNELDKNQTSFYFPQGTWCPVLRPYDACIDSSAGGQSLEMGSKAYEFGLHLRDGHIIPFQDAFTLNAMTTHDLNEQPVEMHIHAKLENTDYIANGFYLNDDGVSLVFDNQNKYYTMFNWKPDTKVATFSVEQTESATKGANNDLCENCINKSDQLSKIVIYNADVIGMVDTYSKVTLTKND